jgi:hypothetical protein
MSGRTVIDVGAAPVEGVVVTVQPTSTVSGWVVPLQGVPLGSEPLVVRLEPVRQQDGAGESVRAAANGAFTLLDVAAGRYRIVVVPSTGPTGPLSGRAISLSDRNLSDHTLEVPAGASVTGVVVQIEAR